MPAGFRSFRCNPGCQVFKRTIKNLENLENKNLPMFFYSDENIYIAKKDDKIYVDADWSYEYNFDSIEHGDETISQNCDSILFLR